MISPSGRDLHHSVRNERLLTQDRVVVVSAQSLAKRHSQCQFFTQSLSSGHTVASDKKKLSFEDTLGPKA